VSVPATDQHLNPDLRQDPYMRVVLAPTALPQPPIRFERSPPHLPREFEGPHGKIQRTAARQRNTLPLLLSAQADTKERLNRSQS
jgi:hypothetical protein